MARGSRLTTEERAAAAGRLAELTGLSADYLDRVKLRPEHVRFLTELLRDRRLVVGRIDGRFTGWDTDYGRESWSVDPSMSAITGPYTAALNHYARAELGYSSDLPYEILTDRVRPWSYAEFENQHAFVLDKLAAALCTNPDMRVHVDCGYCEAGHMMYLHDPSRLAQSERLARFVRPESG
jgi:carboxypeptidase C (cathepsin A)